MEDEEVMKKLEAIVSALAAIRSSLQQYKNETERELELTSRRVSRLERKLQIENGIFALDATGLPEPKNSHEIFLEKLGQFNAAAPKAIPQDDDCPLPKKRRGRPPKKQNTTKKTC